MPDVEEDVTAEGDRQDVSSSTAPADVRGGVGWVGAFFLLLGSLFLAIAIWGIVTWPNAGGLFFLGLGWTMMTMVLTIWWDMRMVTPRGVVTTHGGGMPSAVVQADWIPRRSTHRLATGSAVLLAGVMLAFVTDARFRDPTLLFALCVPAFLLVVARNLRHAASTR